MERWRWPTALVAVGVGGLPANVSAEPERLESAGGFEFPVEAGSTGALVEVDGSYDETYRLWVDDVRYDATSGGEHGEPLRLLDGRLLVLPRIRLGTVSVWREVYVPERDGDWIRYVDVIERAAEPVEVPVRLEATFACCGAVLLGDDVSPAWIVEPRLVGLTSWKATRAGRWPHAEGSARAGVVELVFERSALAVGTGERRVLVTFGHQAADRDGVLAAVEGDAPTEAQRFDLDPYLDDVVNWDLTAPGVPEVRFAAPRLVEEGAPFSVEVEVVDPEDTGTLTWSWDLDDDGVFGEAVGATRVDVPMGTTDGPVVHVVRVRAVVGAGTPGERVSERAFRATVANVAPRILNEPPSEWVVGRAYVYEIQVVDPAGPLDTLSYELTGPEGAELTAGPDGAATVTYRGPGHDGPTAFSLSFAVVVRDDDGGEARLSWEVRPDYGRRPEAPIPIFPVGVRLADDRPLLTVANARDRDYAERPTYRFELARNEFFEGSEVLRSLPVDETPAITSWEVPLSLEPGAWRWRAHATDGRLASDWVEAEFWVVGPVEAPEPLPAPAEPVRTGSRGCDCAIAAGGAPPLALGLALPFLPWVVSRRRPLRERRH